MTSRAGASWPASAGQPARGPGDLRGWPAGPERPEPPRSGEVHLWAALLDDISPDDGRACLEPAEESRMERFRRPRDAARFRNARWMLRSVLGRYLDLAPGEVRYVTGRHGRPELECDRGTGLRFNASASGGVALVGVTTGAPVGVDVERPGAPVDPVALARAVFHPDEWVAITRLADRGAQAAAFYRCWTRKEAVAKGVGLGLRIGFDRFRIGGDAWDGPRAITLERPTGHWTVMDLSTPPAVYAAVALAAGPVAVRVWSWQAA
jgi:4'-phosphopantetheinyl transferase